MQFIFFLPAINVCSYQIFSILLQQTSLLVKYPLLYDCSMIFLSYDCIPATNIKIHSNKKKFQHCRYCCSHKKHVLTEKKVPVQARCGGPRITEMKTSLETISSNRSVLIPRPLIKQPMKNKVLIIADRKAVRQLYRSFGNPVRTKAKDLL